MVDETTGDVIKLNNAVIDGVQRITNFADFVNGEYRLSKRLDDVPFTIEGKHSIHQNHYGERSLKNWTKK